MAPSVFQLSGTCNNYPWGKKGKQSLAAQLCAKTPGIDFSVKDDEFYSEMWFGDYPDFPARKLDTGELLKDVIDAGLVEASATITELLAEMRTQLQHQIPRLRELRVKKEEDPMAFLDSGDVNADIPDDISLAPTDATTSAGTFMTRYTNRSMGTLATNATRKTSKNKRREERKRARGKKGTVYEEEYLVNSISRLIERLNETGDDVARLVEGLMRRAMRERAVAVQAAFVEVQNACKQCMDEVYAVPVPVPLADEEGMNENGPDFHRPWGGQGVLFDALQESQVKREKPVLKAFERLSLLDN